MLIVIHWYFGALMVIVINYSVALIAKGLTKSFYIWFQDPVGISTRQMAKFRALVENSDGKKMVNNFRPVQNLNGRQILDVETSTKRFSSGAVQISSIILPVAISTLLLALLRN